MTAFENLICAKNEHLSKKLISLDNDNQKPHLLYATPEQLPILFDTFFLKNLHDIISSLATHKRLSSVIYCDSYFHEFILPPLYDISSILEATYSCSLLLSSKKSNYNSLYTANYRAIFNLSTHSKILERVVVKQLTDYIITNKIPSIFQSVYLR